MKNFLLKTKKNSPLSSGKRSILKIIIATLVAVGILFLLRGVLGTFLSGIALRVAGVSTYFQTSTATLPVYIRERNELHAEIQSLREDIAAQSGYQSTIARLDNENKELRALMGDSTDERILAGVIARPPLVPYDLLVLDRGSEHGIKEGALVYQTGSHVIGVVSKVFSNSALVTLFTSAGAETTVYLYGPNVFAYAYGEGGGVMRISVPQGIELAVGNPVVLPSIHAGDIGVIERIVSIPTQPEQNAYVTFPIPLQSLRTVSVGKEVVDKPSFDEMELNLQAINDRFRIDVPEVARMGKSTTTPTTTPDVATGTPLTE
jgi:cell shape-determining protein MreC